MSITSKIVGTVTRKSVQACAVKRNPSDVNGFQIQKMIAEFTQGLPSSYSSVKSDRGEGTECLSD